MMSVSTTFKPDSTADVTGLVFSKTAFGSTAVIIAVAVLRN